MNLNEIAARIQQGKAATDAERAFLIANSPLAMAAFMIKNNPGSLNLILRQMGYTHLGFEPKPEQLAAQMGIIIDNKEADTLAKIASKYQVRKEGLTDSFLAALNTQLNTVK